jgi:hypothetical protein
MPKKIRIYNIASIILAGLLAAGYFIINYNWDRINRFDGILNIDEAGYMAVAVNLTHHLIGGGIANWLHVFTFPTIQAPLSYAIASIIMYFTDISRNSGLITNAIFGSVTILFVFLLSQRLSSTMTAIVTTLLVISNPYFTDYTRDFVFAAASASSFIAFLFFFELSEGFARRLPSILCGVCAGLLLLSRTVNISFVPGIVFASLIFVIVIRKEPWRVCIRNIFLALAAAVLVAAPWYYINFTVVTDYLLAYGYGSQATEHSISGGDRFYTMLLHGKALFARMFIPQIVMLSIAFSVYITAAIFRWRLFLQDSSAIFSLYLIVLFLLCFGTLLTSNNMGSGFDVPLISILVIGLCVGIARLLDAGRLKAIMAAATVMVCCAAFAPQIDDQFCHRVTGSLAGAEGKFLRCGGTILAYLQQGGGFDKVGGLASNGQRIDRDVEKLWIALNEQIVSKIDELNKVGKVVVFAHKHIVVNVNTAELWSVIYKGDYFPATQINSDVSDSVDGYANWLSQEPSKSACIFVANTSGDGQFPPAPTYEYLQAAFKQAGLVKSAAIPLPDNRQEMEFWVRRAPACY